MVTFLSSGMVISFVIAILLTFNVEEAKFSIGISAEPILISLFIVIVLMLVSFKAVSS